MLGGLYETGPNGHWVFLLVTVVMGGAAALVTGRAVAATWRPLWQLPWYVLLLTLGVRFLHYALFAEPLRSLSAFVIDYLVLLVAAYVGHRMARAQAMTTQYGWLYESAGWMGWRRRTDAENPPRRAESA